MAGHLRYLTPGCLGLDAAARRLYGACAVLNLPESCVITTEVPQGGYQQGLLTTLSSAPSSRRQPSSSSPCHEGSSCSEKSTTTANNTTNGTSASLPVSFPKLPAEVLRDDEEGKGELRSSNEAVRFSLDEMTASWLSYPKTLPSMEHQQFPTSFVWGNREELLDSTQLGWCT